MNADRKFLKHFEESLREAWAMVHEIDEELEKVEKPTYYCNACKQPLSEQEVLEAKNNGLNLYDTTCDDCWADWMRERNEG